MPIFFAIDPDPIQLFSGGQVIDKQDIIHRLREEIRRQYERIAGAAREARGYATDPDSKAESKYDTRSLEASYLAAGQAAKADELAETLRVLETFDPPAFNGSDPVALGALVTVAFSPSEGGGRALYLLAPRGGGLSCESGDGETDVTVLSPSAPLFQSLEGCRAGGRLDDPALMIVSVA
ncbi:MAG: hypothetical protein H7A53_04980 [Akkermansiaceae bacterium]|nr:hypothetical protein [Akkermansiaceae bacterium]